jgi:glycosyltransferase involved in cell wall biosynthesis
MENKELVSILIPVYNRVNLVRKAINSSINQTYKNIEIIIVDNCSIDGTWECLKEYENNDCRIKIFRNEENIGPVKNWIECIKRATGDYIKILFSDDWMDTNWIENSLKIISSNHNIAFVFSKCDIVDNSNNIIFRAYDIFTRSYIFSSIYFVNLTFSGFNLPYSPGCFLFRREDVIGNLLLALPNKEIDFNKNGAGSDILLVLIIANKYDKVAFMKTATIYLLNHEGSFSNDLKSLKKYYIVAKNYFLEVNKNKYFYSKYKLTRFLYKKIFNMIYLILKSKL